MRRDALMVLCLLAVALATPQVALGQTRGKVTEVRVYRGQALVTRQIPLEARGGPQEVVVADLPINVIPASLYATGGEGVTIRAVRYRATATATEPRPEVRALDEQIRKLEQDELRIASELAVLEQRTRFLDELQLFASAKAREDLNRASLDPNALQATATFVFEQRAEIAREKLRLEGEQKTVRENKEVVKRERAALAGEENITVREAVVFVDAETPGTTSLFLSYLVTGVTWAPAYSVRLSENRDRLALEYHAVVSQMTGEDWTDVKLTLSTSYPDMSASAPILTPLRIALVSAADRARAAEAEATEEAQTYVGKRRALKDQLRGEAQMAQSPALMPGMGGGMGMGDGMMGPGLTPLVPAPAYGAEAEQFLAANVMAAQLQNMELTAPDEVVKLSRVLEASTTEGLAVDYPLPGTISIPSRQDQQMFHITTADLQANCFYTAAPLLTDYVYQGVEAVNTGQYPLLAGPYNAYLGTSFAGRGELALVALGQNLTVGLGTETRLRASRELVEKTTTVRGGNKLVKYTYRIRLRNFMDQPVRVRVWDRLPQAPSDQVAVNLVDPGHPLSEDPLYVAQQKPRGLLRWDVEVPANAQGATAYDLTYQFQIEFDKSYDIGELPAEATDAMRKDLRSLRELQFGAGMAH